MLVLGLVVCGTAAAADPAAAVSAPKSRAVVPVLEVRGAIGPATSRYLERALESAQTRGDPALIIKMDTPGGLDSSMRDIIRAILASRIPVVTYVAPSGARAASAGTYILYASHVAAMAPATNLGAATPVSIGGESPPQPNPTPTSAPAPAPTAAPEKGTKPTTDQPTGGESPQTPMERKVVNDAVAYIRGLAELRGRNADWAEQAVRGAASLSASAALKDHVIDLIARDVPDLLAQIDGRHVKIGEQTVTLATR